MAFRPRPDFYSFLLQNCDTLCKYDNPVYHFKDNFMLNPKITVPFGCVWLDLLIFEIEVRNIWPFGPAQTFIHFLLQNCDTLSKYDNPVYYFKDNFLLNPKITVLFWCVWLDLLIFELEVRNIWPLGPGQTFSRFLL